MRREAPRRGAAACARCAFTLAAALVLLARGAWGADANELYALGAVQKGMGGAGVAAPHDSTWSLLNPATLVDLDRRLDVYLEFLHVRIETEPRGLPLAVNPAAGQLKFQSWVPIASISAAWPLKKGTLGLGLIGVEGNRIDFPRSRTTPGFLRHADRRARHEVARIPFAYARRFDNGWAVGGAIVPAVTRFRTDSVTAFIHTTRGNFEWNWAGGLGLELGLYKRWEKWSVGANWTSRTYMQDYPDYSQDLVMWSLDLPEKLRLGFAYRPRPNLELAMDYKWINWSAINLLGRTSVRGGLGWDNQHILKAGLTWDLSEKWTLRSGFSYGKSPVDEDVAFINALSPALGELHLAAGFTYRLNKKHAFHFSYTHVPMVERVESGNGDLFSRLGKGTRIAYGENSITAQYTYSF